MILSKARSSVSAHGERSRSQGARRAVPELEQFLESRDYSGALALLRFKHLAEPSDRKTLEWLAYCSFHHGEHDKALELFKQLLEDPNAHQMNHTYAAACLFYMGLYDDAEKFALAGPECPLQVRILFHIAHRQNDEQKLIDYHGKLGQGNEDQLSLASIHYMRSHYQEATDIYKRLLLDHRDWLALNVYVGLCYYNLDYFDVSLEILNAYLQVHPESALAVNVKACNNFKLYNGKTAEADLKNLEDAVKENDLLRHNRVVFRNGKGALQVLPPLIDILPEARQNLVIYYLRNSEVRQAYDMVKNLDPSTPQEYILKAVACANLGQETDNTELIKQAEQYYRIVGASSSECDTIPGRQCMASCFILLKQFEEALVYLKSIKAYSDNQDDFNWNYGMAKAATGDYAEAEESLLLICSEKYREDYCYLAWLLHCLIMNGKAQVAWEHYLQLETVDDTCRYTFPIFTPNLPRKSILQLIANESYRTRQYLCAAKAFDALEKMEDSGEFWEGKRGACVGVFQKVIAGQEPRESLRDVILLLSDSTHPQVEYILRIMRKWAKDNNGDVSN